MANEDNIFSLSIALARYLQENPNRDAFLVEELLDLGSSCANSTRYAVFTKEPTMRGMSHNFPIARGYEGCRVLADVREFQSGLGIQIARAMSDIFSEERYGHKQRNVLYTIPSIE